MPQEGMLIQMDGSYHPWLGDLAPPFTLLIAVNDATGTVMGARFCEQEDAHSYFLLIRGLVSIAACPWLSILTATQCSSTRRDPVALRRLPSSAEPWQNWVSRSFSPIRPRPRGVSSERRAPFRTGWSPNCGWLAQPPWSRHRLCSRSLCPGSTGASAFPAMSRASIPASGPRVVPGTGSVFQAPQEGGQGQYGAVPVAHTPAAASAGTTQLCRGGGGSSGKAGRPAQGTPRRTHCSCPRSSARSGIPAQRSWALRSSSGCVLWGEPVR